VVDWLPPLSNFVYRNPIKLQVYEGDAGEGEFGGEVAGMYAREKINAISSSPHLYDGGGGAIDLRVVLSRYKAGTRDHCAHIASAPNSMLESAVENIEIIIYLPLQPF
jgi:hypothetical protein